MYVISLPHDDISMAYGKAKDINNLVEHVNLLKKMNETIKRNVFNYSIYRFDNKNKIPYWLFDIFNGHFSITYQTNPSITDIYSGLFELGMAAPSLYLHHYALIMREVLWPSPRGISQEIRHIYNRILNMNISYLR